MYNYGKEVEVPFEKAIENLKTELAKEGFGVLTEIDMKSKLREKVNVESEKYMILGACNPEYAYQALQTEKEIGLVMPCNLIVYENQGKVRIASVMPTVTTGSIPNSELHLIIEQVEKSLKRVVDSCCI